MSTTALAEDRSPARIQEFIDGYRLLITDAVLEGENDTARRYAERVAILRDQLLTSAELVTAAEASIEYQRAAREAAPPDEDAPEAGSHQLEGENQNANTHEGEPIMSEATPRIASPAELTWMLDIRESCDNVMPHAIPILEELGYPWDPDRHPTDVLSAIDTARAHCEHAIDFDTTLPAPPNPPEWAVMTTVVPSMGGAVLVTHRSRLFDLVHIESQIAYQVYPDDQPAGTIAAESVEVVLPRDIVTAGAVPASIARRLGAALAAAAEELERTPHTVRRPLDVDEQLRSLEA